MTKMNERTLNALFNVVTEPIKNVYNIENKKNLAEIKHIIKVFNIAKEQKAIAGSISARGLVAFKMLVSNN